MSEDDTSDVEIVPGQPATHDVAYCMSEVKVVFHSTFGTFLPAKHPRQQRLVHGHGFSGPRRQL